MTQDDGVIPPLENGDRLTRAEFERRYDAMPELKRAELLEGEVYMPSPVRHGRHSHPHTRLVTWLGDYETDTLGVEAGDNGSIRLDLDNDADYRGGVTCLYDTQLLGACLHASESGGRSRPEAVRGMPEIPIAPPATGPNSVRLGPIRDSAAVTSIWRATPPESFSLSRSPGSTQNRLLICLVRRKRSCDSRSP